MMPPAKATKGESAKKGSGKRRRWGGKTGLRRKVSGKWVVVVRSATHGGHSPANAGYECGAPVEQTRTMPGKYKVPAPSKRHHRRGFYRSAS